MSVRIRYLHVNRKNNVFCSVRKPLSFMNNFYALKNVSYTTLVAQIPPTVIPAVNSCFFTSTNAKSRQRNMVFVLPVSKIKQMVDINQPVNNNKKVTNVTCLK